MNAYRWIAVLLIVLGALSLAYGGFSYTRDRHQTQIGPIEISIQDKETVNVPLWVGIGLIAAGALLFVYRRKS